MTIDDLVAYKNFVYGEYDRAKDENNTRKMASHAFHVASLEESIADELIAIGKPDQAVINLISQGSLLMELGRIQDCKAAWERAKGIATNEKVIAWIETGLAQCQSLQ